MFRSEGLFPDRQGAPVEWHFAADQDRPSEGDGYVRAETIWEAVALIGHPEVNVYPLPANMRHLGCAPPKYCCAALVQFQNYFMICCLN